LKAIVLLDALKIVRCDWLAWNMHMCREICKEI